MYTLYTFYTCIHCIHEKTIKPSCILYLVKCNKLLNCDCLIAGHLASQVEVLSCVRGVAIAAEDKDQC